MFHSSFFDINVTPEKRREYAPCGTCSRYEAESCPPTVYYRDSR